MSYIKKVFLIVLSLCSVTVFADFKIYLTSKLGTEREVTEYYVGLTTSDGQSLIFSDYNVTPPLAHNQSILLQSNVQSDSISTNNAFTYKYQCANDPGGLSCFDINLHGISFPGSPMYCYILDATIDTADKLVHIDGVNTVLYQTKSLRFYLEDDFTVSYRVTRKSTRGKVIKDQGNLSLSNSGLLPDGSQTVRTCQFAT